VIRETIWRNYSRDTDCEIVDVETGTRVLPPGETGEIRIRGPQVMKGYWNRPDETAIALRDGWLYTGDLGTTDQDGFFTIVDRKKDMIISSGYNVYPRDVEEVLYEHPAVLECCVAGIPDAYRGETVKAFVVLRAGASPLPQRRWTPSVANAWRRSKCHACTSSATPCQRALSARFCVVSSSLRRNRLPRGIDNPRFQRDTPGADWGIRSRGAPCTDTTREYFAD
jgi:acyl-CoA synthetase (AMP-forming)/AMP-acid ligase II